MTLRNIFAAYIDQSTLEEAVVDMAGIGVGENHQEFLDALDWGIAQCESGNAKVLQIIVRSCAGTYDLDRALTLLRKIREMYLVEYQKLWGTKTTRAGT